MSGSAPVMRRHAHYGTWESPITSEMLAIDEVPLYQIVPPELQSQADATAAKHLYYIEGRPAEEGRRCIVECNVDEHGSVSLRDVLPREFSAKSSVHEYGGAAVACQYDGKLIFCDGKSQGIYSLDPSAGTVEDIVEGDAKVYYADFDAADALHKRWILAVCEDHRAEMIVNSIVAIDMHSKIVHTVITGADFYAHPQLKMMRDGQISIAWTEWNHPDMPWTGSQLYMAKFLASDSGKPPWISDVKYVAGKAGAESVAQPKWNPWDESLLFCDDRSGYWQLYHVRAGEATPELIDLPDIKETNLAGPEWWLGVSSFAILDRDSVVAICVEHAVPRLVLIDLVTLEYQRMDLPPLDSRAPSLHRISKDFIVLIGSTDQKPTAVLGIDIKKNAEMTVIRPSSNLSISADYYSISKPIKFPQSFGNVGNSHAWGMYLSPRNPHYQGVEGTLPPLIMYMHGGPTSCVGPGLSMTLQYWTTRGYAVVSLNYSGSSGFSRSYRDRLDGKWGLIDVADAASCVEYLASTKMIDKSRVGIVGGSAGGYACLQALCLYPEIFAGGVSLYGISDLKALLQDTHKFESRYADRLLYGVGTELTHEEKARVVYDRSPVHHAQNIRAAILLLQGTDDKVVPPNQAQFMIDVINEKGGDGKLVFYQGEGHGFAKAETIINSTMEQEMWWRKTLLRETASASLEKNVA